MGINIDFVNEVKDLGTIGIIGNKVNFVNEIKVLGNIFTKSKLFFLSWHMKFKH